MITIENNVIQGSVRNDTGVGRMLKRNSEIELKTDPVPTTDTVDRLEMQNEMVIAESFSDSEDEMKEPQRQQSSPLEDNGSFEKQVVTPRGNVGHRSALSAMLANSRMNSRQTSGDFFSDRNQSVRSAWTTDGDDSTTHGGLNMRVHFPHINDEPPFEIEIEPGLTVSDFMQHVIEIYNMKRDNLLAGDSCVNYDLRMIDDFDLEVDFDISPFPRDQTIGGCNVTEVAMCRRASQEAGSLDAVTLRSASVLLTGNGDEIQRKHTMPGLNPGNVISFVRVAVPGPEPETHVFKVKHGNMTLRDLFAELNRKKRAVSFHSRFFDFYYQNNIHEPLEVSTQLGGLRYDHLVVLPRTHFSSEEERQEALQFEHVREANEYREFSVSKVKSGNKKGRILGVDRWRIIKKVLEDGLWGRDHLPIDIPSIIFIKIDEKNALRFTLKYSHPNGGTRKHQYECRNETDCSEFVRKVKYLVQLRKLQP